jgi:phytoene synthase
MIDLAVAYQRCEEITRTEAKNFAYGIRLLPPEKRLAMSALYAFARRVDDIGDGTAPAADKLQALEQTRSALAAVRDATAPDDPVLLALGDAAGRFPIPLQAFGELIDGCEMDCRGTTYQSFDDLALYCRRVAGSIGRLSLGVFGLPAGTDQAGRGEAERLADALGTALQLTNILRDIVEDRTTMGRVYLPADDLAAFGCRPDASGPIPELGELVRFEAARAKGLYRDGLGLLCLLDHRSRACVAAMAGIYRRLLARIEEDPAAVLVRRVSLPTWEKAWVAARSLAGAST